MVTPAITIIVVTNTSLLWYKKLKHLLRMERGTGNERIMGCGELMSPLAFGDSAEWHFLRHWLKDRGIIGLAPLYFSSGLECFFQEASISTLLSAERSWFANFTIENIWAKCLVLLYSLSSICFVSNFK